MQCTKFCTLHFRYLLPGTKICTLHFITYPDVVYKVATAAILIQTRVYKACSAWKIKVQNLNYIFQIFWFRPPLCIWDKGSCYFDTIILSNTLHKHVCKFVPFITQNWIQNAWYNHNRFRRLMIRINNIQHITYHWIS